MWSIFPYTIYNVNNHHLENDKLGREIVYLEIGFARCSIYAQCGWLQAGNELLLPVWFRLYSHTLAHHSTTACHCLLLDWFIGTLSRYRHSFDHFAWVLLLEHCARQIADAASHIDSALGASVVLIAKLCTVTANCCTLCSRSIDRVVCVCPLDAS